MKREKGRWPLFVLGLSRKAILSTVNDIFGGPESPGGKPELTAIDLLNTPDSFDDVFSRVTGKGGKGRALPADVRGGIVAFEMLVRQREYILSRPDRPEWHIFACVPWGETLAELEEGNSRGVTTICSLFPAENCRYLCMPPDELEDPGPLVMEEACRIRDLYYPTSAFEDIYRFNRIFTLRRRGLVTEDRDHLRDVVRALPEVENEI